MSESGYFEIEKLLDITKKGSWIKVKIQWKNFSDGSSWEPLENVSPDCVEEFLSDLLLIKPQKRELIKMALNRIKRVEESCEEITLSSDSNHSQLTIDPTNEMPKRFKNEIKSILPRNFDPRTQRRQSKAETELSPQSHPKKKAFKKKLGAEKELVDTKIMIRSILEQAQKPKSKEKELQPSPNIPRPSTGSGVLPKPKVSIPKYKPVIHNAHNYFHISGPGQEVLNSFCFNFTNFKNSFCPLAQSRREQTDYQFLFADIHTVISPSFFIKGLQIISLDADNKHLQFRCNVVQNGTKVLRNVESLYASHPNECFVHLKRKLVQICLLKKFFSNYFDKVTSI